MIGIKGGEVELKRIVLVIILMAITLIMTGCVKRPETDMETKTIYYAQLIMPDGTIVEGECTYLCRHSNGWIEIYIDGVEYLTDKWRVVTWKGQ